MISIRGKYLVYLWGQASVLAAFARFWHLTKSRPGFGIARFWHLMRSRPLADAASAKPRGQARFTLPLATQKTFATVLHILPFVRSRTAALHRYYILACDGRHIQTPARFVRMVLTISAPNLGDQSHASHYYYIVSHVMNKM